MGHNRLRLAISHSQPFDHPRKYARPTNRFRRLYSVSREPKSLCPSRHHTSRPLIETTPLNPHRPQPAACCSSWESTVADAPSAHRQPVKIAHQCLLSKPETFAPLTSIGPDSSGRIAIRRARSLGRGSVISRRATSSAYLAVLKTGADGASSIDDASAI